MILLDRLIQISDHILNKEIVIESMGELGGSFIEIPNNNHLINHPKWDYFVRTIHIKSECMIYRIKIFIDEKIIELEGRDSTQKIDMNDIITNGSSYLILKYGKILLEEV